MGVKVYISGISGNYEIRKHQQRVLFVLSSLKIQFEVIDITEMGKESEREFMREQCKLHNKEKTLPPQIFKDEEYCGDYDDFEVANEEDRLMSFLKLIDKAECDSYEKSNTNVSNPEGVESEALTA